MRFAAAAKPIVSSSLTSCWPLSLPALRLALAPSQDVNEQGGGMASVAEAVLWHWSIPCPLDGYLEGSPRLMSAHELRHPLMELCCDGCRRPLSGFEVQLEVEGHNIG